MTSAPARRASTTLYPLRSSILDGAGARTAASAACRAAQQQCATTTPSQQQQQQQQTQLPAASLGGGLPTSELQRSVSSPATASVYDEPIRASAASPQNTRNARVSTRASNPTCSSTTASCPAPSNSASEYAQLVRPRAGSAPEAADSAQPAPSIYDRLQPRSEPTATQAYDRLQPTNPLRARRHTDSSLLPSALAAAAASVAAASAPPQAPSAVWFHGSIDRREAESRLLGSPLANSVDAGLFLVRRKPGIEVYAISTLYHGRVMHHLVQPAVPQAPGEGFLINALHLRNARSITDVVSFLMAQHTECGAHLRVPLPVPESEC